MKRLTALVMAFGVLAAACSSSSAAETTTTTSAGFAPIATTSTVAPETTAAPETTTTEPPTTTEPVDDQPPVVEVTPADGAVVDTFMVPFGGTTEPGADVTVNGVPMELDAEGSFAVMLASDLGENDVTIEAADELGNTGVTDVTYTFEPADGWIAAIGDSVMLGSKDELEKRIGPGTVDATVSRQFGDAPSLVSKLLARPVPPQVIVVHLGTNGPVQERHFEALMEIAADVPLMVFINAHVPTRNWESTTNNEIAAGVERHDNAVLVDWHTPTKGRSDLFAADNFHPKQPGRVIYAELVAEAIFPNWESLDE
jgi:hypothetical protein